MKTRLIIILPFMLLALSCNDLGVRPPDVIAPLDDRVAGSQEFKNTLIATKKIFKASTVQLFYSTKEEANKIASLKESIINKEQITGSDILTLFNYPKLDLLKRHLSAVADSFDALYAKFPELKSMSEKDKTAVLQSAITKYRTTYSKIGQKKIITGGRIESCDSDFNNCLDRATNNGYLGLIACGAVGTLIIAVGVAIPNPAVVVGGLGVGEACILAVQSNTTKQQQICSDQASKCRSGIINSFFYPFQDLAYVNGTMNYIYDDSVWPEVTTPPIVEYYYTAPDGHIYYY